MSEGSYVELALRDLAIEIEKIQEDRDYWRNVANCLSYDIERLKMKLSESEFEYQKLWEKSNRRVNDERI